MNTYCNLINFPQIAKDILTNDANIVNLNLDSPTYGAELILPERFPKEFNAWLEDTVGLTVDVSEIFYLKPYAMHPIHTDGRAYPNQKGKLNFIIGGKGSEMVWYEPLNPDKFKIKKYWDAGQPAGYLHMAPNEAKELHSAPLNDFCIVDAGTFHTVKNKDELRIAWNLVLADCKTKQRLLLPDLQNRLSEYVVD
jgi:hypothetical protein